MKRSILDQFRAAAKHQTAESAPSLPEDLARELRSTNPDSGFPQPPAEFAQPEDTSYEGAVPVKIEYAETTRLLVHRAGHADPVHELDAPEAGPTDARWCRTVIPEWGDRPEHCACGVYLVGRALCAPSRTSATAGRGWGSCSSSACSWR